jgi:hypothetical protein
VRVEGADGGTEDEEEEEVAAFGAGLRGERAGLCAGLRGGRAGLCAGERAVGVGTASGALPGLGEALLLAPTTLLLASS